MRIFSEDCFLLSISLGKRTIELNLTVAMATAKR